MRVHLKFVRNVMAIFWCRACKHNSLTRDRGFVVGRILIYVVCILPKWVLQWTVRTFRVKMVEMFYRYSKRRALEGNDS